MKKQTYSDLLDLLFANRNKAYGAYALRREYPATLGKALGLLLLAVLASSFMVHSLHSPNLHRRVPKGDIINIDTKFDREKEKTPKSLPKLKPLKTAAPQNRAMQRFVPPIITNVASTPSVMPDIDSLLASPDPIGGKTQPGTQGPPSLGSIGGDTKGLFDNGLKPQKKEAAPLDGYEVDREPSFPGGEPELFKYLQQHIKYPGLARDNGISGVVVLSFVVGTDGSIRDVQALRELGGGCTAEAIRVVSTMPKWMPGELHGEAVRVRFTLPVRFELN